MIYSKKMNCVYVAIPKCGTTTILKAIEPLGFRQTVHNYTWPDRDWPQRGRHDPATLPGAKTFTVVRHPLDRLASQFNDLMLSVDKWEFPGKYDECDLESFCHMLLNGDVNERPWLRMTQSHFLEPVKHYTFHRLEDIAKNGGLWVLEHWVQVQQKLNSRQYDRQPVPAVIRDWIQQDIEAFRY
jgi:hypothetical protein